MKINLQRGPQRGLQLIILDTFGSSTVYTMLYVTYEPRFSFAGQS